MNILVAESIASFLVTATALFTFFVGPVVTIFALNMIFKTEIELTWTTWIAMMWLHIIISKAGVDVKQKTNNAKS